MPDDTNTADDTSEIRIPATPETWLAAQLHEALAEGVELRSKIAKLTQTLLSKDQDLLLLRKALNAHESKLVAEKIKDITDQNEQLRETYKIREGGRLRQDDETGEVYWIVSKDSD